MLKITSLLTESQPQHCYKERFLHIFLNTITIFSCTDRVREKLLFNMLKQISLAKSFVITVNSLVSDHPWGMTKWLLTGGGRLRGRSTK